MNGWPAMDWDVVHRRLVAYATRCLGGRGGIAAAEDLTQSALRTALEKMGAGAPPPANEDEMVLWLGAFVANLAKNRAKSSFERRTDSLPDHWDLGAPEGFSAFLEGREHHQLVVSAARARGDTLAVQVLECITSGVIARTEQADRIGCAVSQVDQARHRIRNQYLTGIEPNEERSLCVPCISAYHRDRADLASRRPWWRRPMFWLVVAGIVVAAGVAAAVLAS